MMHPIHRVTAFSCIAPYTISVSFSDGSHQVIDFRPVLRGDLFGPLRDEALFKQVRLDSEVGTLVWPNDADFDPATRMTGRTSRLGSSPWRSRGALQTPSDKHHRSEPMIDDTPERCDDRAFGRSRVAHAAQRSLQQMAARGVSGRW